MTSFKKQKEEKMRQLKKDLQAVSKSLKRLIHKIERIAERLGRPEKAPVAKRPKAKAKARPVRKAAVKKRKKTTVIDTTMALIERSKKGIDKATLKKKTGATDNNLRTIIYRLMKQGKIKSGGRGIYLKA